MANVLNIYKIGKCIPDDAEYIGRPNASLGLAGSKFANIFPITETDSREIVVEKYKNWLWQQIKEGKITLEDLLSLEGKNLVCYCAPQLCHGDVLLKAIIWARNKYDTIHGHWTWEEECIK